jgi:hypothetical protein
MGLTRLRAEQISDIDYKQAVRVITVTDITNLAGGAPSQVDSVNLAVGDRILVTAQSPGSENGIYQVQTVGTGSNGTWIRSIDTNQTGELEAGTIVMVTEGTVYADTQWKLTTNNPIIIGTTPLTFEQNSAYAFGNLVANTTAVLANSVGSTVTFAPGTGIQITGNNTTKTVTIAATGSAAVSEIVNGTSNVAIGGSGANVTVGVAGTANVAEFSTGGLRVTGFVSASGNITGGNIRTVGLISATGNITGNFIIGNGSQLTGLPAGYANTDAAAYFASGTVSTNILTTAAISATGNVTGGNIRTAGLITATGAITTAGDLSLTGNIVDAAALFITTGANGNITMNPNGTGVVIFNKDLRNGQANGVGNIGSSTGYFNTVFAKATSAQYADLAEMYVADVNYPPGTLVEFGGVKEITITTQSHSTRVAGIVSTNPSYLMNATQSGTNVIPVALTGRVPCSVIGTIEKGDRLVASNIAGVAQRLIPDQYEPACIVGKALENYASDQPGVIEVAVGRT